MHELSLYRLDEQIVQILRKKTNKTKKFSSNRVVVVQCHEI
jgi:phosphoglycerate-specific signal transduction histidine kinase